ncbi:ROK family protein [Microlunatus elymi]|uniref:ROK family protein n=1 Tax=Microlunatus elymi TaxID=2596828 RepID=A0A516Q4A6_9ACTN|nr:ROK family protein [Microlunatus elymi]QDP98287.1 ROK family protein [Microlunatus elymi]
MASIQGPSTAGDVLALVREGATTRSDLGRLTGLSRTAVAARVAALLRSGLLVEADDEPSVSTGGRPPGQLRFNRDAGVVLAGAIGRSRTQVAVCDLDGTVLAAADVEQEIGVSPDQLMPAVVGALTDLLDEIARPAAAVRTIGLSIPGTVDIERGASLDSPIMTGWDGVPLAPYLADLSRAPVFVENDANAMALSERRGHLEQHRDLTFLKASTGIGIGVVVDGRLVRGRLGAAGEIGHTKITAAEGLACRCGDTGCLEALAGGWALVRHAAEAGLQVDHVRDLAARAVAGDAVARRLTRDAGRRTGEVLAAAVNLLNPEVVVVGGDLAAAYDSYVAGLRESLYAQASALATRELAIVPLTHGERAGVVGCAALALGQVLAPAAVDRALAG